MDRSYHFRELEVESEDAIDEWVQTAMMQPLDKNYPVWRVTVLRAPEPDRSALFWQLHHSIGDGLSLLFAFSPMMGCAGGDPLAKIPLPSALLPPEKRKAAAGARGGGGGGKPAQARGCCRAPCAFVRGALTPALVKHDTELRINPPVAQRSPFLPFNGRRAFTRFPRVKMDTVKSIKDQHSCSVNDVLMAALTGALRRYGAEVCGDPLLKSKSARIDFKSMVMLALPRPVDMGDLAGSLTNKMLFVSCPLPIDEPTALGRLQRTIAAFANMKSSAYIAGVAGLTDFVKGVAPTSVLQKTASETFSKHSLLVTNVPSTTVPITFPKEGGEQVSETHMVFPNVIPQVSIITYNGFVNANIVADPELFPTAEVLGEMFQQEFEALASCDLVL